MYSMKKYATKSANAETILFKQIPTSSLFPQNKRQIRFWLDRIHFSSLGSIERGEGGCQIKWRDLDRAKKASTQLERPWISPRGKNFGSLNVNLERGYFGQNLSCPLKCNCPISFMMSRRISTCWAPFSLKSFGGFQMRPHYGDQKK